MRIVNAMFGRGLGGIEQALLDYGDALRFCGHNVHTVIHPKAAVRPLLEASGHPFHTLSNLGTWDIFAIGRLRQWLRTVNPDAAIAHGNRAVSLLRQAGCQNLIAATHNYTIRCKKLAAVFCPTLDLMRHTQAQGVLPAQTHYIPNMVRVPASLPPRTRQQPPRIGTMGRFVLKKGFDVFIDALAQLQSRGVEFQAVLAGNGEEAATLHQLAADRHLNNMLFPGWVKDKQAFFDSIDVFCLPSRHEPFGIVLLEAMAQGVPVVTAASEGPSEIISHGQEGLIVPVGNAIALADAMETLLADAPRATQMAANAWHTVRQKYSLPVISAKLDLALRSVV